MNVALVVLDTLRKDRFDEHFEWLPGRRFENAWATSNWTVPSHASLFGGEYASELGVYAKASEFDCDRQVLAEQLSEAGYTTRGLSANPNVSKRFDFDRGFDDFHGSWRVQQFEEDLYDWESFAKEHATQGWSKYPEAVWKCFFTDCATIPSLVHGLNLAFRPGKALNSAPDDGAQSMLRTIEETNYGDDEFLFLNLMEAHGPYDVPEEFQTTSVDKPSTVDAITGHVEVDSSEVQKAYDDCVSYLSDMYEDIFSELRHSFDYIITTSDHGELLGEHDMWDHLYGLFPEVTYVPLVVSGDELSGTHEGTVSLLDVHRTILELTGTEGSSRGRDLLSAPESAPFLTEYHGLSNWALEALEKKGVGEETRERYDTALRGVVVPPTYYGYETDSDWRQSGDHRDRDPHGVLDRLVDSVDETSVEAEESEISEAARRQLEELGYA